MYSDTQCMMVPMGYVHPQAAAAQCLDLALLRSSTTVIVADVSISWYQSHVMFQDCKIG